MAKCEEIQTELSAYLDGEVQPVERASLSAHLQACAACRAVLASLENVKTSLADLPQLKAPSGLAARIHQAALNHDTVLEMPAPARPETARQGTWSFWRPALVSLAALVMLGILLFEVLPRSMEQPSDVAVIQPPSVAKAVRPDNAKETPSRAPAAPVAQQAPQAESVAGVAGEAASQNEPAARADSEKDSMRQIESAKAVIAAPTAAVPSAPPVPPAAAKPMVLKESKILKDAVSDKKLQAAPPAEDRIANQQPARARELSDRDGASSANALGADKAESAISKEAIPGAAPIAGAPQEAKEKEGGRGGGAPRGLPAPAAKTPVAENATRMADKAGVQQQDAQAARQEINQPAAGDLRASKAKPDEASSGVTAKGTGTAAGKPEALRRAAELGAASAPAEPAAPGAVAQKDAAELKKPSSEMIVWRTNEPVQAKAMLKELVEAAGLHLASAEGPHGENAKRLRAANEERAKLADKEAGQPPSDQLEPAKKALAANRSETATVYMVKVDARRCAELLKQIRGLQTAELNSNKLQRKTAKAAEQMPAENNAFEKTAAATPDAAKAENAEEATSAAETEKRFGAAPAEETVIYVRIEAEP